MHRLPPLIELRAFDAAARHMSFEKAADELGVTPTAISHQIRLLESYCGCALFRRRPRPLALTSEGARLFPVIRDGLESFAAAIEFVRRTASSQPLRVTTTNAFASRWLVPRLPQWRALHRDAALDVIGTDAVIDLRSGDADVAIRYARAEPADGIVDVFLSDRFFPVCSPRLATSRFHSVADMHGHVLVHCYWSSANAEAPTWRRWLAVAKHKWPDTVVGLSAFEHLSFREELHAIEAVIDGQGIGLFSDVLVAAELASGALVKLFDLCLPGCHYFIVRRANHARARDMKDFAEWLQSVK
jgi:LysR family transcriptional regulator, glycine cleavage system transcriptional activator